MAGPITWRNVEAANLGGAGNALLGAQDSINGAFSSFQNILNQRQQLDAANLAAGQEAGKQNYLDKLGAAKTPEEVAALQASGALSTDGLTAAVRGQLRGADEARLSAIRQQITAGQAYDAGQVALASKPILDQIATLSTEGKFGEARALVQANPTLPGIPAIMNGLQLAERGRVTQSQTDAAAADHLLTTASQRNVASQNAATNAAQAASQAVSAGAAASNAKTAQDRLASETEIALQGKLDQALEARSKTNQTISSQAGSQFVIDEINKVIKDPKQAGQLLARFGEMATHPTRSQATPDAALKALLGDVATGNFLGRRTLFGIDGSGDSSIAKLDEIMQSDGYKAAAADRTARTQQLDLRVNDLRDALYPNRAGATKASAETPAQIAAAVQPTLAPQAAAVPAVAKQLSDAAVRAAVGAGDPTSSSRSRYEFERGNPAAAAADKAAEQKLASQEDKAAADPDIKKLFAKEREAARNDPRQQMKIRSDILKLRLERYGLQ